MIKKATVPVIVLGLMAVLLSLVASCMRKSDAAQEAAMDAKGDAEVNATRIEGIKEDVLRIERKQEAMDDRLNTKLDRIIERMP